MRRHPKKGGQFAIIWVDLLYEDSVPATGKLLFGEIYRLAGPEDQRSIFESLCDFYNGYDPTIGVQVSLDSRSGGSAADEMFGIRRQGNDLDPIRDEAVDILRMQYKRGNNGYVKTKYVTLTIEAENLAAAKHGQAQRRQGEEGHSSATARR